MRIDPQDTPSAKLYFAMASIIVPRPIAWVSTLSRYGIPNLAPFSFFTGVTSRPPTVAICIENRPDGSLKDTAQNILETKEFVINVVPSHLAEAMVATSGAYPPVVNEFGAAGVRAVPAERVKPSRVAGVPAVIECSLHDVMEVKDGDEITSRIFLGRVELIVVRDDAVDERGHIDSRMLDPLARLGGSDYARLGEGMKIQRPKV
ncbi:MAG: flavin reductase family protein [Myxococcales bacterium]|nr:flavin reductase family protein [Myxococcales bacterium]MCB9523303.1 flavin reductase family protein [Myxococcales bacterium]